MCYEGLISIRGLCAEDTAKYYLDDIGISLLVAANTADEKYGTGKKLIEAKIKQAWEDAFNDIQFKGLEVSKTLNDVEIGVNSENGLPTYSGFRGLKYKLDKNCKLSRFFIHKITLAVKIGGQTSIIIRQNGVDKTVFTGIIPDGEQVEITYNDYVEDSFQILADNTNLQVYSGTTATTCNCRDKMNFTVTGSDDTNQNFGIITEIQVRCDKSKYLCKYADKIATAVRYKAAALVWKEIDESNRINDLLTIKKDDAVMRMAWLDSTFNLIKYDPAVEKTYTPKGVYQLELAKLNIPIPKCPCCLECASDGYTMVLP